jgi:hypothetical protein
MKPYLLEKNKGYISSNILIRQHLQKVSFLLRISLKDSSKPVYIIVWFHEQAPLLAIDERMRMYNQNA